MTVPIHHPIERLVSRIPRRGKIASWRLAENVATFRAGTEKGWVGSEKDSLPVYWMTSPDAKRFETRVILTLTWSPGFVFGTKTTRHSTRAIPSPRLLISLTSTSYSLPSSTGFGPKRFAPPP